MFDYNLAGRSVVLVLEPDMLKHFKTCGIPGSPLFAVVYRMEEAGLWLETVSFPACPIDVPQKKVKSGETFCKAHIFIPARAIISVVAFPEHTPEIAENSGDMHRIGFLLPTDKS